MPLFLCIGTPFVAFSGTFPLKGAEGNIKRHCEVQN